MATHARAEQAAMFQKRRHKIAVRTNGLIRMYKFSKHNKKPEINNELVVRRLNNYLDTKQITTDDRSKRCG